MGPSCPTCQLGGTGAHASLLLVGAGDADRLCGAGGYERVDAKEALSRVQGEGRRARWQLREFAARARLFGGSLSRLDDEHMIRMIDAAIRSGALAAIRQSDALATGEADDRAAKRRRLVRDLGAALRGRRLNFAGRTYRLVADVELARLPDRDSYQVVGQQDSRKVLDAIAAQPSMSSELRALLSRARDDLTSDWRPPIAPDGLILLRRVPVVQSSGVEQASAMTPSQIVDAMLTWITIETVDADDAPWTGPVELTLTDGSQKKTRLAGGSFHQDRIPPGTVTVKFLAEETPQEGWADGDTTSEPAEIVTRVRMMGMLFDSNKCFLLPQGLPGIRSIIAMHEQHENAEVLIVGHAGGDEDLAGADIALDRAKMLAAFLTSDPEPWVAWFGKDKNKQSRWGTREVQLMLSVLPQGGKPFYQGNASGVTGAKTSTAIRAFQKHWNLEKGTRLVVDGKAGPATSRALVAAYMGLQNTTLADHIEPVVHGAEGHQDDALAASGLQPDERRIEVFFFEQGIDPEPGSETSDAGAPEYEAWLGKVSETKDFENHGIHVQIRDLRQKPVPGCAVTYSGPTSGEAQADDHGFVSLFGLKAGQYTIHATRDGDIVAVSTLTYPTAKLVPEVESPPESSASTPDSGT
jgi:hypothetical protein